LINLSFRNYELSALTRQVGPEGSEAEIKAELKGLKDMMMVRFRIYVWIKVGAL